MLHTNLTRSGCIGFYANRPIRKIRLYWIAALTGLVAPLLAFTGTARACSTQPSQTGVASYYGPGFQGHTTATGETYNMMGLTAAHGCLPLGTRIRVTVIETGRSLIVTINDRMPSRRRMLDLSVGAARALGITARGIAMVMLSPA